MVLVVIEEESSGTPYKTKISFTNRRYFQVGHGRPVPDTICQPVHEQSTCAQ